MKKLNDDIEINIFSLKHVNDCNYHRIRLEYKSPFQFPITWKSKQKFCTSTGKIGYIEFEYMGKKIIGCMFRKSMLKKRDAIGNV